MPFAICVAWVAVLKWGPRSIDGAKNVLNVHVFQTRRLMQPGCSGLHTGMKLRSRNDKADELAAHPRVPHSMCGQDGDSDLYGAFRIAREAPALIMPEYRVSNTQVMIQCARQVQNAGCVGRNRFALLRPTRGDAEEVSTKNPIAAGHFIGGC